MPAASDPYVEHPPAPALRSYVECYWIRSPALPVGAAEVYRVLPDGCLDIVFTFGDPWARQGSQHHARSVVVGTMTRPLLVESGGWVEFLGVRFRPGQARRFLQLPAAEVTDSSADLAGVWGRRGRELEERLLASPGTRQRLRVLETELLRRLASDGQGDARVDAAVEMALRRGGVVSVEELSAACNLTRQNLARTFRDYVGIPPKLFCRVLRFQALLRHIRGRAPAGWATLAAALGYYDQAHLIADFKEFAGLTPTALLPSR